MKASKAKIKKYLTDIENNIEYIKSILNYSNDAIKNNSDKLDSLKYRAIILIEAYMRLFQHILSHNHNISVTGMIDTIEKAKTYKWVDEELFIAIKNLIKTRNTHLIHEYNGIDEEKFINSLRNDISVLSKLPKYIKNNFNNNNNH